jgi:hypothetical protein
MFQKKSALIAVSNRINGRINQFKTMAENTEADIKSLKGIRTENVHKMSALQGENEVIGNRIEQATSFVNAIRSSFGLKESK